MSAAARSCNCTLLTVSRAAQLARTAALACGIACFVPPEVLQAATLVLPGARAPIRISNEPFGLLTSAVTDGELKAKWLSLERKLRRRTRAACAVRSRSRQMRLPGCAPIISRSLILPKHAPAVPGWAKSIGRSIWLFVRQGTSPNMAKSTSGVHHWLRFTEEPEIARTTRSRSTSP